MSASYQLPPNHAERVRHSTASQPTRPPCAHVRGEARVGNDAPQRNDPDGSHPIRAWNQRSKVIMTDYTEEDNPGFDELPPWDIGFCPTEKTKTPGRGVRHGVGGRDPGSGSAPIPVHRLPGKTSLPCGAETDTEGSICERGYDGGSVREQILQAIAETLPLTVKLWEEKLRPLCWRLKAMPALAGGAEPRHLRWAIDEWWRQAAAPPCRLRVRRAEVRKAFARYWDVTRHAIGNRPIDRMMEQARQRPTIDLGPHAGHCGQELQDLARLCAELGPDGNEFFLSCRQAAELMGKDHKTAIRYLKRLRVLGLLVLVERGTITTGRASVYWWTGFYHRWPPPRQADDGEPE
jgi:hypothetical protein